MSTHTNQALEPDGPIALDRSKFDSIDMDDTHVFEAAFRKGWVRASYIPDDGGPLGSQVGLHGPDEETVRLTLKMLLDKGLQVDHAGMRGHYDGFEYDDPLDAMNA